MKLSRNAQKTLGLPALSEAEFTRQVLGLARVNGWRTAHFRPAQTQTGRWLTPVQGDGKGFPDILMVRKGVLIAAELKVGRNKPTPEQIVWLAALEGAGVLVFHWRPEDWRSVEAILGPEDEQP